MHIRPDYRRGLVDGYRLGNAWTGWVLSRSDGLPSGPGWRRFTPHAATCVARVKTAPRATLPDPLF